MIKLFSTLFLLFSVQALGNTIDQVYERVLQDYRIAENNLKTANQTVERRRENYEKNLRAYNRARVTRYGIAERAVLRRSFKSYQEALQLKEKALHSKNKVFKDFYQDYIKKTDRKVLKDFHEYLLQKKQKADKKVVDELRFRTLRVLTKSKVESEFKKIQ